MCGFVVSCVVTAGLCSCRVRCFVSCPVVNVFALGRAWFWVGLVGVVTCDVSLLLQDSSERFRTFCENTVVSRWCFRCLVGLLCVAFRCLCDRVRRSYARAGGGRCTYRAMRGCFVNAVRVLLGIAAVGVRVMMCVRLCSLPPFFVSFVTCWCGRAVACGRVMTRVVVQRSSSCDRVARLRFPCVGRCNRLFVVASLVVVCALAVCDVPEAFVRRVRVVLRVSRFRTCSLRACGVSRAFACGFQVLCFVSD